MPLALKKSQGLFALFEAAGPQKTSSVFLKVRIYFANFQINSLIWSLTMLSVHEVLQRRYRIVRLIGEGSTGAVYEAVDESFGEPVAVKEVLYELTKTVDENHLELLRNAFKREAKSLAKARHPTIPYVRDYFFDKERQYLVMDLVDGDDLGTLLVNRGEPFPLSEILDWGDQLLDALTYLHTLVPQVIHGDIKPKNLKLSKDGRIKLLDLGITKSFDDTAFTIRPADHELSALNYLSFEQVLHVVDPTFREFILMKHRGRAERVLKQSCDVRSDIYMLGATLYYLLTNRPATDIVKRTIDTWEGAADPLPDPSDLNPGISPSVAKCILKALAIDRDDRYASASAMRSSLNDAASGVPEPELVPSPIPAAGEGRTPDIGFSDKLRLAMLPTSNGFVNERVSQPLNLEAKTGPVAATNGLPAQPETRATTKLTFSPTASDTKLTETDAPANAEPEIQDATDINAKSPISAKQKLELKSELKFSGDRIVPRVAEPKSVSPPNGRLGSRSPVDRIRQAPQRSDQENNAGSPAVGRGLDLPAVETVNKRKASAASFAKTNGRRPNNGYGHYARQAAETWKRVTASVAAMSRGLRSITIPQFPLWLTLTAIAGVLTIAGIGVLIWILSLSRPAASVSTADALPNRPAGQVTATSVAEPPASAPLSAAPPQTAPAQAQPAAARPQSAQPVASLGDDQASVLNDQVSAAPAGTQKQTEQKQKTQKPVKQNQTDPKPVEAGSPTPAVPKPEKKKVTVDDLINDN
jgi:serine/threonine protein kinase